MKGVTGVGGVFIKAKDPAALREWYRVHLGIGEKGQDWAMFHWLEKKDPPVPAMTVWNVLPESSDYFDPSPAPFMINYRVEDIDAIAAALEAEGIQVKWHTEADFGRFCWISDPEGNRIELWEPPAEDEQK